MYLSIIFLPLIGSILSGLFGRFLTPKGSAFVSILGFENEGPLLYQIDPSGVFLKSRADSIGRKACQVK